MATAPARVNHPAWRGRLTVTYCAEQQRVQAVGMSPAAREEKGAG
jgi:hypothetical protein